MKTIEIQGVKLDYYAIMNAVHNGLYQIQHVLKSIDKQDITIFIPFEIKVKLDYLARMEMMNDNLYPTFPSRIVGIECVEGYEPNTIVIMVKQERYRGITDVPLIKIQINE